ncbi:MAG: hypothetical protein C0483_14835 [Pirellula sp.]|nr:hypothetical protein [Pirellula sp.]
MELLDLTLIAWILLGLTTVLVTVQTIAGCTLGSLLLRHRREPCPDADLPTAAVVVAIRGPDPFLEDMLDALIQQDYPRFVISIVLDDAMDPAADVVRSVIRRTKSQRVRISVLKNRSEGCSLKCSSLIQGIEELEPEYEVVAFIDGDAKPSRFWLRDLVAPLKNEKVGVVTGNRWYMPDGAEWGSLVRYFWNAGAFGQMWFNGMVWAGSMAMRRETIERINLLHHWSRVLSVDSTLYRVLRSSGLKAHFAPSVVLVNSEVTSLPSFNGWVRRQLVGAKSGKKSGWYVVLLHAIELAGLQVCGVLLTLLACVSGNLQAGLLSAAALALYWTNCLGLAMLLEAGVRHVAALNGQPRRWIGPRHLLRLFPAMVVTHFVYVADLLAACFCKRVSWRGVDYELLDDDNKVRLVAYRPYRHVAPHNPVSSVA